ncbi:hypothetical protein Hanom_Chr02g00111401 [Helianthus anomalus]
MGNVSYKNLMQDYGIRAEWNPVLPSKTDMAFPLKEGKITLFSDLFKFCNFRLPTTKFCKLVLDHYRIHISQLHPLGLVKLRKFEFACAALGHIPELIVFRAFFILVSRDKDWKKKFFYIDASVIPDEMHWMDMGLKDKVKDDSPPEDAYIANALYTRLCDRPFERTVIPEGALVMAGMNLLWRNIKKYPSFWRNDEGAGCATSSPGAISVARCAGGTGCIYFPSSPSGGSSVAVPERKPTQIKVTGRKYMAAGVSTSSTIMIVPVKGVDSASTELTSPTHVSKKRKTLNIPALTAFEAMQAAYAPSLGATGGIQVENVTPIPLSSVEVTPSTAGGTGLLELISQASLTAAISCTMPSPLPRTVVTMTTSPVSMPVPSSVIPSSLFESPLSIFSATEKEMPTVSLTHEANSTWGPAASDVGGSSNGIANDGACLDKCYQPRWKIAESSTLIFPPIIQHWVEQAYPPAESAYVEGLNNENLMNSLTVDSVSQPCRLAEIPRRLMHDNNELYQARAAIQELKDEMYRLKSQLQAAGLRESRFLSEKNKAEDDLKRVTAHLAEERIIWARDIAEKDRVLTHVKSVQEELERKAITEAQKVRSEMSAQVERFRINTDFVSQVQERYQALTVEVEASHTKVQAKQAELEEREDQLRKLQQLYRLSAAAYQSGHHDGVYTGYHECHQSSRITPEFHAARGKLQGDMVDVLEAVCNEPLAAYDDLTKHVAEDGVEALHLVLEPAEESEEE